MEDLEDLLRTKLREMDSHNQASEEQGEEFDAMSDDFKLEEYDALDECYLYGDLDEIYDQEAEEEVEDEEGQGAGDEEEAEGEEIWTHEDLAEFMELDEDVEQALNLTVIPYEKSFALISAWASPSDASIIQRILDLIIVELIFQTGLDLVWRFFHRRELNRSESFSMPRSRSSSVADGDGSFSTYSPAPSGSSFRLTRTDSFVYPTGALAWTS